MIAACVLRFLQKQREFSQFVFDILLKHPTLSYLLPNELLSNIPTVIPPAIPLPRLTTTHSLSFNLANSSALIIKEPPPINSLFPICKTQLRLLPELSGRDELRIAILMQFFSVVSNAPSHPI